MPLLPDGPLPEGAAHGGPEAIAIVGLSFQFPGGCDTPDAFWQALLERRSTSTEAPEARYSASSLWHPDASRRGTVALRGGHFLAHDISRFDAPFFSISDTEAAALDPQQRGLLETTFRALENAGQGLDQVAGSKTSVFTGCFTDDWKQLSFKDAEQCASHSALGVVPCTLANRLSWFFNFKGASCNLDSACSSGLLAVDLACKSLAARDADMSIAAGCNLLLFPDIIHCLSNLGLLSPDSQSYPFDSRANGYARGDGFGVLVLKRLSDAIANNDVIRAVIRASGSNQDGHTPSMTTPSGEAQADLIRSTYARAGLSLAETRFVEAHGTGTQTGDPIEIDAIGTTFRSHRSPDEPLYVGAVKGNIGHLEGASGIAALIKTVLILEKGVIPPNANFETLNPKIDLDFLRIRLPLEPTKWPSTGLRRASVNSFGFGGSNSHVIVEDAYHYLRSAGLKGNHNTIVEAEITDDDFVDLGANSYAVQPVTAGAMEDITYTSPTPPKLVVLSANDETTLNSQTKAFSQFFQDTPADNEFLTNLIYTLNERRNAFPWRSTALLDTPGALKNFGSLVSKPHRAAEEPALCFVLTGQGAQYPGQALHCLEQYTAFRYRLDDAEDYLIKLGCQWRVRDELYKSADVSRVNDAEYSQPLSTIVQIALIDLLRTFGVYPSVVIGHSSGEMAAAYCTGALSARSAIKVAYFRGYHSASLAASGTFHGAMMAAALNAEEAERYIEELMEKTGEQGLTIACINSPKSVTISGGAQQIDLLGETLSRKGIFVRKLNVNMAYHSPAMQAVAQQYYNSIGKLERGFEPPQAVTMLSTITSNWVQNEALRNPQYWVDNMISPVQFSPAVEKLTFQVNRKVWKRLDCSHKNHPRATFLLEVGFHGALRGPLRDILSAVPDGSRVAYEAVLSRGQPPFSTLLGSLGQLFSQGYPVNLRAVNTAADSTTKAPQLLCNLPEYRFNHSKSYWEESRISKRFRSHPQQKLDLLGKPCSDWNKAEAKWRNFLRISEMPWVEDHKINETVIYPGAGMLVMAIEAANQLADPGREVEGFELKDIQFLSTLPIPRTSNGIETHLYLRESRDASISDTPWLEFRLFCFDREEWVENCRGAIRNQYKSMLDGVGGGAANLEKMKELNSCRERELSIPDSDGHDFVHEKLYEALRECGFDFGASFQLLRNGVFLNKQAKAEVALYEWPMDAFPQPHIVHPCSLDAMLHLTAAAFADGGRTAIPTAIPSSMRKLWISKKGLSSPQAKRVRTTAWMTYNDTRGTEYSLNVLDNAGDKVLMRCDGLRSTVVAHKASSTLNEADEKQICYHLDWKPADSFISATKNGANGVNGYSNGTSNGASNGTEEIPQPIVVADLTSDFQKDVSLSLESIVAGDYHVMGLSEAVRIKNKSETPFIFLDELEHSRLMDLSETDYAMLQSILSDCKASLWVTNGGGHTSKNPTTGVANGLFRVLRNERPEIPYATLALDVGTTITENQVYLIHKVFQTITHFHDAAVEDQEYVEMDGVLHVPRVTEAKEVTKTVFQNALPQQTTTQPLKSCPPVQLGIESIGFLDTLQFTEDDTYDIPLEPDEVEIQVCAAGVNFRDVLVALGRVPGSVFGSEAAGVVSRVGSPSLHVSVGDRVVMAGATFRTFARAKAPCVQKIQDTVTFPEAASIATQFCTAWHAVNELARLQSDESILIHTGAGGTGQAAIQVAQYIGATIYATVGSEAKKQLLMQEYGIPESHIFYSRNTSFAKGVMRMTGDRGVDVVLNSLAGDSLVASWECIAPYGRFIELGKKDILRNSNLPMDMFRQNTQFICFDGFGLQADRPKVFARLFEKVMSLFKWGVLRPAKPLNVFHVSRIEDAFRAMQDGNTAGKIVLEFTEDMEIKTTLRTKPSFAIDNSSTYVIAGGLGGVGRNVARWLVDRGARHLLLLSRSGAKKQAAVDFMEELTTQGVAVKAPPCDVTNYGALKEVIEQSSQEMPPIMGCVQGSMVLRDSTFNKMSHADWRVGTDCKTAGSWNLHQLLPAGLDFFIMLSSASSVVGLHGQANYAAGNAYMDALARYRVSRGLRAVSLDLGALTEDGLLAEDLNFLNRVLSYGALNGISRTYFNAIMDYYCNPSLQMHAPIQSQPIIGLDTSDESIIISRQPIFSTLTANQAPKSSMPSSERKDWRVIFADPANHDIPSLVTSALVRKLSKTNSELQGEVDVFKPLVAYGVDSLLAVELRSWLAKEFGADVALFEIQGGVGFEGLGRIVAARSKFGTHINGS